VYGTLQDEALVERLVGRRLPSRPAVLEGYRRTLDDAIGYPVVHPSTEASVDGRLVETVDAAALAALDAYEGAEYRRVVIEVRTSDGRTVDAHTYVPVDVARASR
jgi:gamma-glutamylcyclotransferase (GGCT)/AIG2-like uncharacterized protein YtfP